MGHDKETSSGAKPATSSAHQEMAQSTTQKGKKNRCASCANFLYDKETGQVMGRKPLHWLYLLIFYLVFWGILAAFFAAFYELFFNSLSMKYPRIYGDGSFLKDNSRTVTTPGMSFGPQPDSSSSVIRFQTNNTNPSDNSTYADYIAYYDNYFTKYEDRDSFLASTSKGKVGKICAGGQKADTEDGCFFDIKQLGDCARGGSYGFNEGKPCIMLRLNRIISWEPKPIICTSETTCAGLTAGEIEYFKKVGRPGVSLEKLFDGSGVPFTCEGMSPADRENLLGIDWFPSLGTIPLQYFPYMNQDNFLSPIVMAKITVTPGVLVMMRCRAWALNIRNNNALSREGAVHFELLIDNL